jgi:protein-disulfide isomerase
MITKAPIIAAALAVALLCSLGQAQAQTAKAPAAAGISAERSLSDALAGEIAVDGDIDPAALDAYLRQWIAENAGFVFQTVQDHLEAEQAKNQPTLADFVARVDELVTADTQHDGADPATAETIIVEFFDYNCHFCKVTHPELKAVIAANPTLSVIYRDFPILAPTSYAGALAARAAGLQGAYIAYHDALYARDGFDDAALVEIAETLGLDMERWQADLASDAVAEAVDVDHALGRELKVGGTPFLFVWSPRTGRGALQPGAAPKDVLQALIDEVSAE